MPATMFEEDQRDLQRYRQLYRDTGSDFWKKGIEYLENGRSRPFDHSDLGVKKQATRIVQKLHADHTYKDMREMMNGRYSLWTFCKVNAGDTTCFSEDTAREICKVLGRFV